MYQTIKYVTKRMEKLRAIPLHEYTKEQRNEYEQLVGVYKELFPHVKAKMLEVHKALHQMGPGLVDETIQKAVDLLRQREGCEDETEAEAETEENQQIFCEKDARQWH